MIYRNQQEITIILMALSILWIFSGCSYKHPSLRQTSEAPPRSVETKPKTQTEILQTTIEPKTKVPAAVPKAPVKPKTKPHVREEKIPDRIETETRFDPSGTTPLVTSPPTKHKSRYYVHRVRWPGETLLSIAKWYTGSVKNWNVISNANPKLNPKKIAIGDTISIPEELLISRKPMPLNFVRASVRKKSTPLSSSKKKSTQSESPKLFGPIETEQKSINSNTINLFAPIE